MPKKSSKFVILLLLLMATISCSLKKTSQVDQTNLGTSLKGQPPAYVQKAWDARYSYDPDRRLLVPEYAGSRWGAVQQYKEEGQLVYQDWWVRDVRSEDLEGSPDTAITSFINEDGNLTLISKEVGDDPFGEADEASGETIESPRADPESDEVPFFPGEESPFTPSPFSPF